MYKNENGKLIERLEKQNATLLYCYGFDCGTTNTNNLTEADVIRMHSAIVQLDTDGNPIGTPQTAQEHRLDIPMSEFLGKELTIENMAIVYVEKFLEKNAPIEDIGKGGK